MKWHGVRGHAPGSNSLVTLQGLPCPKMEKEIGAKRTREENERGESERESEREGETAWPQFGLVRFKIRKSSRP